MAPITTPLWRFQWVAEQSLGCPRHQPTVAKMPLTKVHLKRLWVLIRHLTIGEASRRRIITGPALIMGLTPSARKAVTPNQP